MGLIVGLQILIREFGDVTILDLHGRATINDRESELLASQLQELIAKGVVKFLLNLAELSQIDSSGLSVIATTCTSLREQGGDLRFLRPRSAVLEAFNVLRLTKVVASFEDENQALASFRPQSKFARP
jgi:anti-anti-sigma factor